MELQEGQQHLEPPVRAHRERLLTLLQESWCRGNCKGALSRASALQLGADFSQVQAPNKPTGTWEGLACTFDILQHLGSQVAFMRLTFQRTLSLGCAFLSRAPRVKDSSFLE